MLFPQFEAYFFRNKHFLIAWNGSVTQKNSPMGIQSQSATP